MHFESSDGKIDTKDGSTKNTNIKEGGNVGNGQVAEPDVEIFDIPGYDASQGVCHRATSKTLGPNYFICKHFQKGRLCIIFPPKKPSCFIQMRSKMWSVKLRSE